MTNTYTTKSGDTFDMIAYTQLGSEAYTSDLIAANIQLADVAVFGAGTVLNLPTIDSSRKVVLPPWRQ